MAKVTNSIMFTTGGGGTSITVVANYSALPDPTTVSGQFYWAEASQGTSWLPGAFGGTYYNSGMYYSNGVSWTFMNVPYQATQAEVNTGTNNDKFVTPSTLSNSNWAFTVAKVLATALSGLSASSGTFTSSDTILGAFGKLKYLIDTTIPTLAVKSTSAYSIKANNTNATADEAEFAFRQSGQLPYTDTPTFTAGTAPSGVENKTYNWQRIGNIVKVTFTFDYVTPGATVTQILIPMPSDLPDPVVPTGFTGASVLLYIGSGYMATTLTATGASTSDMYSAIRRNSANNDFEFMMGAASGSYRTFRMTIEYPVV
jgi:hypothetical protein